MSRRSNITMSDNWFAGEHKRFVYTVDDQNARPRVVRDITGWTIAWQLADTYSGPALWTVQAELTTPEGGVCAAVIPKNLTLNMVGDRDYYYTMRRTDSDFEEELAYGTAWLREVQVDY